jgi:glycosyltransferase involved in cell wall biosynthesis
VIETSPISAVVLTYNEERNIGACLDSLGSAVKEILVVDSGSTDRTVEIARSKGARVVHHAFEGHAVQWEHALSLPIEGEWILALDADQRLSPRLALSLVDTIETIPRNVNGLYVNRLHVYRGRALRHGGLFPKWMLKAFRKGTSFTDKRERMDHHFYVTGATAKVADGVLIEDNRNERDIGFWIEKHNRYAVRQASEELERSERPSGWPLELNLLGSPDQRVLFLKSRWYRMPLYVRPFLYFVYRYFFRLGFLDGKEGFIFHVLHAFWYRLLVDIRIDEMRSARRVEGKQSAATDARGRQDEARDLAKTQDSDARWDSR